MRGGLRYRTPELCWAGEVEAKRLITSIEYLLQPAWRNGGWCDDLREERLKQSRMYLAELAWTDAYQEWAHSMGVRACLRVLR